jgi:hypothetical protein
MSFPTSIEHGANNLYVLVHTDTSSYKEMWSDFHSAALETGSLMLYQVINHQGRGGKDINLMVCSVMESVLILVVFFSPCRPIGGPTDGRAYEVFQRLIRRGSTALVSLMWWALAPA